MNKNKPLIVLVSPNYLLLTDFTYWLFVLRYHRGGTEVVVWMGSKRRDQMKITADDSANRVVLK